MKNYTVEVDISLADETLTTYISVTANNPKEAHILALKKVNASLDIRVETNPPEALEYDGFGDTFNIFK